jgi:hypothetical protein
MYSFKGDCSSDRQSWNPSAAKIHLESPGKRLLSDQLPSKLFALHPTAAQSAVCKLEMSSWLNLFIHPPTAPLLGECDADLQETVFEAVMESFPIVFSVWNIKKA